MSKSYKKIHVITGLSVGGAETFLYRYLLSCSHEERVSQAVFSLTGEGYYGQPLLDAGVDVFFVKRNSGFFVWFQSFLRFLLNIFIGARGSTTVFWMYHPMLISIFFIGRSSSIVWAVRRSLDGIETMKKSTRVVLALCKIFSKFVPDKIFYNSQSGLDSHEKYGFCDKNSFLIQNGVDAGIFKRTLMQREKGRAELGLSSRAKVVVFLGRLDVVKGPDVLKRVLKNVISMEDVFFVIVGRENKIFNFQYLTDGLEDDDKKKIIMLGQRSDVSNLLSVADYILSCSYCEGFPNAIAEAMAASLVPIVTDVGDSRFLVGECGEVCPAGDYDSLSQKLLKYISNDELTKISSDLARARVLENFSFEASKLKIDKLFS